MTTRPAVLILEARRDIADALHELLTSANYRAIVRPHVERLADLEVRPAAIVTRITSDGVTEPSYAALEKFPDDRPPVVAIAWADDEVREAARLKCDVVLRAPAEVGRLCDALMQVIGDGGAAPASAAGRADDRSSAS
jgi:hypothetical protein